MLTGQISRRRYRVFSDAVDVQDAEATALPGRDRLLKVHSHHYSITQLPLIKVSVSIVGYALIKLSIGVNCNIALSSDNKS